MANKLPKKLLVVLGIALVVLASAAGAFFVYKSRAGKTSYSWSPVISGTDVSIFLESPNPDKVTAAQIDVSFNKDSFDLVSAEPGGFFASPLVIKQDLNNASFALSVNPGNRQTEQNLPLIKLHFAVKTGANPAGLGFEILPTSQIYITGIGGIYPK